jgi:hypothetical protein
MVGAWSFTPTRPGGAQPSGDAPSAGPDAAIRSRRPARRLLESPTIVAARIADECFAAIARVLIAVREPWRALDDAARLPEAAGRDDVRQRANPAAAAAVCGVMVDIDFATVSWVIVAICPDLARLGLASRYGTLAGKSADRGRVRQGARGARARRAVVKRVGDSDAPVVARLEFRAASPVLERIRGYHQLAR